MEVDFASIAPASFSSARVAPSTRDNHVISGAGMSAELYVFPPSHHVFFFLLVSSRGLRTEKLRNPLTRHALLLNVQKTHLLVESLSLGNRLKSFLNVGMVALQFRSPPLAPTWQF